MVISMTGNGTGGIPFILGIDIKLDDCFRFEQAGSLQL
jgi:hypothetical protein